MVETISIIILFIFVLGYLFHTWVWLNGYSEGVKLGQTRSEEMFDSGVDTYKKEVTRILREAGVAKNLEEAIQKIQHLEQVLENSSENNLELSKKLEWQDEEIDNLREELTEANDKIEELYKMNRNLGIMNDEALIAIKKLQDVNNNLSEERKRGQKEISRLILNTLQETGILDEG